MFWEQLVRDDRGKSKKKCHLFCQKCRRILVGLKLLQRVDSLEKTLMLGEIGGRRRRGRTQDEMAGWHHGLDGRESE